MKKLPAIIAALVTSGLILVTIVAVGLNAYANSVSAASLPGGQTASTDPSGQVQQLQDLVAQYQAREEQYKALLAQAQDNTSQSQGQLQQYESLFVQLQRMGVIQVDTGGQVTVMTGGGGREFRNDD